MAKLINALVLCTVVILFASCEQKLQKAPKIIVNTTNKGINTKYGPDWITRNIIQDKNGNIWMATFKGVYKYDGKVFSNVTGKISSARFFSILQDRSGAFWFGSIGEGVYRYDEKSFQHFTIANGLLNNSVGSIYQDKRGNIWFGVSGGISRYDGKTFKNYVVGDSITYEQKGEDFPGKHRYGVNAIIEDYKGKVWFGTDGDTFVFDGKTFSVFTHESKPFKNVRSIIKDGKGNIWLGGADGLWRYDGNALTNINKGFVGYVIEDGKNNIWISAGLNSYQGWALSKYEDKSLLSNKPILTRVVAKPMTFGILEDNKGNIWFGDFDGVHRYDGKIITDFNSNKKESGSKKLF